MGVELSGGNEKNTFLEKGLDALERVRKAASLAISQIGGEGADEALGDLEAASQQNRQDLFDRFKK